MICKATLVYKLCSHLRESTSTKVKYKLFIWCTATGSLERSAGVYTRALTAATAAATRAATQRARRLRGRCGVSAAARQRQAAASGNARYACNAQGATRAVCNDITQHHTHTMCGGEMTARDHRYPKSRGGALATPARHHGIPVSTETREGT